MHTTKRTLALIALIGSWLGIQQPAFAELSGDIQGLNKNNSTNWGPSSAWSGGNLQDWLELDFIPVRAVLEGGPQANQPVTLVFPKFKTDAPGFQNLYFISNSPNVIITSNVLNAPPAPADWSYSLRVTITDNQPGYIYYYARLAAGSHLNVGSSLHLEGEPSLSPLQIHKPDAGPGSPDLAITKTGPANAGPGDIITYTITYTNKAMGSNNTANGVQLSDQLPPLVTFVSASHGGTNEAGFLTWDLPDLTNRASGFVTYQVRVATNAVNGQMFTNNALILSSEDDANILDNRSSVKTTVIANRPPVANPDAYTINEDTVLNVAAPGILANDSDPDPGNVLRAVLVATTTNGTLSLSTNGSFTYTPNLNFNGIDTFTYRASDGSNVSSVVSVTITVNPTNDSPVAVNDAYTMIEDTTLTIVAPGVLANDSDVDGNPLSAVLVTDVAHGALNLSANGAFTYTPSLNYTGTDMFVYRATDGLLSSNATVTITILPTNDAPVAVNDNYATLEDTTLTIPAAGVLANDSDVDGDALSAILVTDVSHGTLSLNANGAFVYTPSLNYTGIDVFTYRASDGSLQSSIASVTITITATNDAPVALDDAYTMNEDTVLTVVAPGVLANDSDVDGDALASIIVAQPTNGLVTLNANGSFVYAPNTNYHGIDTFTYRATDSGKTSGVAVVTITINPTNDVPAAIDDFYTVVEDNTLTIPAPGILANDIDVDGDPLSAVLMTGVAHGTLTFSNNGAFIYTPSLSYTGIDTFTYRATDGALASSVATVTITITPVNDSPVAINDAYTTPEDTTLTIPAAGVLANDSDVDGDPLSAMLVSGVSHGTLNLSANGAFIYTPSLNYTGVDVFVYRATDGVLSSNATVTITITPLNDSPVAVNDSYSTLEDTTLTIPAAGVLANDSDVDADPLTSILVSGVSHGTLNLNANGSFTYTPSLNYTGVDVFVYRATDGVLSSNATVTITIFATNDAPVAVNDNYSTLEDTTLTIAAPGVLANDSDVDGNPLSAILVTGVAHGTLNLTANGAFVYTPSLNYTGVDTFTYRASDGIAQSGVATVTITIIPTNDAPVARDDAYTMNEDTVLSVSAPGLLVNDSDVDGDPIFVAVVEAQPTNGAVTWNPNGSFVYRPNTNYHGLDAFTYRIRDASLTSGVAVVTITINPTNDVPLAVNDAYTTPEDTTLTIPARGILTNDIDVDGNVLYAVLVNTTTHGTLSLSTNGAFTYTPSLNYTGVDTFTYRATDGALTSEVATVTITITPLNDPPVAANNSYSVNEDTTLNIIAPGILGNDSDVDGDPLSAVLVANVTHGMLNLSANGAFVYTPSLNYTGVDTFTYRASDGALQSGIATVTITVLPLNDTPVAVNDAYTINEDTVLTVSAPGVLANDSDVDGDALAAVLVTNPAHGSLTLQANGAFVYTPNANYNGTDSFTYRARDYALTSGVATVTITINPTNDAPVANNDAYVMNEDTVLTVIAPGILANDTDVDGNPLSSFLITSPTNGTVLLNANGSFTYRPNTNYNGPDAFTYRATDGALTSGVAVVTITINPTNDVPLAVNDAYTTIEDTTLTIAARGILTNDVDVDGDLLSAVLVSTTTHGTLNLSTNGAFVYTPSLNYTGVDTFTYRATDGALTSGVATVTITITPVNDSPVAINDAYTTPEDTTLTIPAAGVLANDSDVDGNPLSAVLVNGVSHGTLNLSANGAFVYTPSLNYTGVDTFTYRASDGALQSSVATVTITVTPLNDTPVAANDFYTTPEDTTLTIPAAGVLANDSDVDGDPLSAVLVNGVSHGTLNLSANGAFVYTPSLNYTGVDTFTYRASDGALQSGVATVTITVTPVNDRPTIGAAGDNYSVLEDQVLTVTAPGILANDNDVDGDPLTSVLVSGPSNGTLTLSANGSFVYRPATNYFGPDSFVYVANDGQTNSLPATVNITVTPVNDAPSFTRGGDQGCNRTVTSYTVPAWAGNISAGPANESSQSLNFIVSNDNNALFTAQPSIAPNGTLTYTTASGVFGTANVSVRLRDNGGTANGGVDTSSEVVFRISVNNPPSVSIVSPTNGNVLITPVTFSVIASANDPDGTVTNIQFLINGVAFTNVTSAPFYFILSNAAPGNYQFTAIASDNCGMASTSSVVNMEVMTNAITVVGPIVLNRNNGLFEQFVTVSNRTSETWANGVRLYVKDLASAYRVWNVKGTNNGVPYLENTNALAPGGTMQFLIQYYGPNPRTFPDPTLIAVPLPFSRPVIAPQIVKIESMPGPLNKVSFTSQTGRFYFIQFTENFVNWTTDPQAMPGTGGQIHSMQNGSAGKRFYRVLMVP